MKWKLLIHTLFASIIAIMAYHSPLKAKVFASQITIANPDGSDFDGSFVDGSGASIAFMLNDAATGVTIDIVELSSGNTVHSILGGPMDRGLQSVAWDGTGATTGIEYAIRVTAEQDNASNTQWTRFFDSGDIDIFTRGVAVVRDQSDPNFGLILASNDGGPLGTGITTYNPDGSNYDPFLRAADMADGGSIDYGEDAPLFAVLDWQGRLWVTLRTLGQVMRINRDFTTQVVIDGLTNPTGLYLTGEEADFTLYVAADSKVLRGNIGTANTFDIGSMETVAEFGGFFPRQIMLDDEGFMYLTLRESATDLGSNGRGIRKFDISGSLPVIELDALWVMEETKTFIANDLLLDRGADLNSATDDLLYYCTRAGGGFNQDGIWRVSDINSFDPDTVRIITEIQLYFSDENINARATMDFDAAGNIILMENANEHIFFISPPGEGATNSFTSTFPGSFTVTEPILAIDSDNGVLPIASRLKGNYPNPFNPATTIAFDIEKSQYVTLNIFDMLGRKISSLVEGQLSPGSYTVLFEAENLPSGIYIYELRAGSVRDTRKMLLNR